MRPECGTYSESWVKHFHLCSPSDSHPRGYLRIDQEAQSGSEEIFQLDIHHSKWIWVPHRHSYEETILADFSHFSSMTVRHKIKKKNLNKQKTRILTNLALPDSKSHGPSTLPFCSSTNPSIRLFRELIMG